MAVRQRSVKQTIGTILVILLAWAAVIGLALFDQHLYFLFQPYPVSSEVFHGTYFVTALLQGALSACAVGLSIRLITPAFSRTYILALMLCWSLVGGYTGYSLSIVSLPLFSIRVAPLWLLGIASLIVIVRHFAGNMPSRAYLMLAFIWLIPHSFRLNGPRPEPLIERADILRFLVTGVFVRHALVIVASMLTVWIMNRLRPAKRSDDPVATLKQAWSLLANPRNNVNLVGGRLLQRPQRRRWTTDQIRRWIMINMGTIIAGPFVGLICGRFIEQRVIVGVMTAFYFAAFAIPAIMFIASPVAVAAFAAGLTARDAESRGFDLLQMSEVSDRDIAWGYLGASMARLWGFLMITMLFIPALAVPMLTTLGVIIFDFTVVEGLRIALNIVLYALGIIGANLLGGAIGVAVGLRVRDGGSALYAALITLGIIGVSTAILLLDLRLSTGSPFTEHAGFIFFSTAPFLLAIVVMDLAQKWVQVQE